MAETAADRLVARPPVGRVFSGSRAVRFGDVSPTGRVRLDALSTYVQDLASDDTAEMGVAAELVWVVRRTVFEVSVAPRFLENLELTTWCSGLGRRWAERRISMTGERGGQVESAILWVALDRQSNRPVPLPPDFIERCGPSAQGREVSARLHLPATVPELECGAVVARRPWALRATDFDLLGHVNNAAAWALVEEGLADVDRKRPLRAEMEYRVAVEPGAELELVTGTDTARPGVTDMWAVGRPAGSSVPDAPITFTAARVTRPVD